MQSAVLAVSGAAVAAALLHTAPAARADSVPPDGRYVRVVVDSDGAPTPGSTAVVNFTSCGDDCVNWNLEGGNGASFNLYRQGNKWMRSDSDDSVVIIDADSLKGYAASKSGIAWWFTFTLSRLS